MGELSLTKLKSVRKCLSFSVSFMMCLSQTLTLNEVGWVIGLPA